MNRITFLLLFAIVFTSANLRAADFTVDDIAYTITSSTVPYTVAVSSKSPIYTGAVTIPASVSYNSISYSVTSIGASSFYYCTGLTSVNFSAPSSLTSIGDGAFYQCTSLTSVTIPSSVTSIGINAFVYCTGLTSVNFSAPSSLTSIGQQAFFQCQGLTSITFPSSVTSIGPSVFYGCSQLTSVNFSAPSSLTTLGNYAFYYCTGLTSVNLSAASSLISIGNYAFQSCTHLTSVNIPSSVTSIGDYSFYSCTGLTSVSISATSSLTSIGDGAFYGCTGLTSVNIPSSVTSIEGYTFYNCYGLTSITIPPSITSIGTYAFYNCTGLTSIYAQLETPVNLSSSPSVFNGVNTSACILHVPYGSSALYAAADQWNDFTNRVEMAEFKASATKARIESAGGSSASIGLTTAQSWTALSNQSWLTVSPISGSNNATLVLTAGENTSYSPRFAKVTVSAADVPTQTIFVTQLGVLVTVNNTAGGLFAALTAAQRSQITRLTVTGTIDARDFKTMRDDMPLLAEIDISGATIAAFTGTGGTTAGSATYPVNTVPQYAFYNSSTGVSKTSLTSIILPSTATSIGSNAFYRCSGLSDITIPSSVTSIGYQAFYQCIKFTSVTIPSSVTSIEHYAFQECTGLTSVNFSVPSSLTSMGTGAFIYCSGLTSVTIPSSLTSIPIHAFYQCTVLTSVNIPSSVTSIEEGAFYQCGLTSVNIPSSVTSIGQSAFSSCNGLTSVNIPSSVNSLGANAFAYCYGLTSVTFSAPSSLTTIGGAAFYYCTKLTSVILPESVTSIGTSAFSTCTVLSTVSIPSTVTFIGEYCFYNSTGLTSIYAYPVTPVSLTASVGVFLNVNKTTCKLFVPYASKVLYAAANQWKDFATILEIPTAGSIGVSQTICYNTSPATITSTSPGLIMTGATLSYRWEYSTDGNWQSTGGTAETFAPGSLTKNTMFRRITISTLDGFSWESVPTAAVTITVMPLQATPTIEAGGPLTFCAGGSVTLTSSAGTGYKWSTGANTASINVTSSGTYSVQVIDANGCLSAASLPTNVTVNPLPATPSISAGGQLTFCAGGSVTLTSTAGTNYKWSTGATTSSINVTMSGSYTVQVTNANGCQSAASLPTVVTVNDLPATPTISAGGPLTFCDGGSVTLTSSTGTNYKWSTGATTSSINVTTSGSYTVQVTNANGCLSAASLPTVVTVNTLPATPTISASGPLTFCDGGSVTLTSSAGIGYKWSTGATTASINVTKAGSYTVQVTNANGCLSAASLPTVVTVNDLPATPTISAGGPLTFCDGGSVTLTSSAGTGYKWSTGATTASITVTKAGSYTVQVTNANGCLSDASIPTVVTVNALPATPTISAGGPLTFCAGGSVTLTSSAGTGYKWSTGATTASIDVTSAGSYTVQVTNATGCQSVVSLPTVVAVNDLPVVDAGLNATIPYGTSTILNATVTGTGPFTYSWSPAGKLVNALIEDPTTVNLTETTVFTFTATSTTTSCSNTDAVTITVGGGTLSSTPTATPATVCAGADIQLDAVASGGSGSYTYNWTSIPEGFTSSLANPKANPLVNTTYHVTVFDGFTTVNSQIAVVVNSLPATPTISASGPLTFCDGGSVTLTSSTGTGYKWSTGATTASINVTKAGSYTVQVTNANGCLSAASLPTVVTVNDLPATPTISAGGPLTFCDGGSVTLTSSAGTGYKWSTGATTASITVTKAGSYTVQVTNANGCLSDASIPTVVTVNALPATPTISAGGPLTFCAGGSVTLTSSAGTGYKWSTGATTASIDVTSAGSYTVQVTNATGCQSVVSLPTVVAVNDLPVVDAGLNATIPYGTSTILNATVTGTGPFTYSWSPAGKLVNALIEDPTTVNLTETTVFTFTATSTTTSCSNTDAVTITVGGGTLSSTPTATPATVCAGADIQLDAVASGGSGSYTYNWTSIPEGFTSSLANPKANPLVNTTYHVTVFDGFTTVNSQIAVVVNSLPATPTISASGPLTFCDGGSVTLTSSTGTGYKWSTGATTASINVTKAGSYTVQVTNANGCLSAASLPTVVTVNLVTSASVSIAAFPSGAISAGTSVTFTTTPINGGTAPVYQWYKGTTAVGSNSPTYTYVPDNGDVIKVVMTSNATPCLVGSPATSNSITIVTQTQGNRVTSLMYIGTRCGQYGSTAFLSTILWDTRCWRGVSGKTITFTIGTQTKTAVTNSWGVAITTLALTQEPGTYRVLSNFAGDNTYMASSDNNVFTITRKTLTAGLTGTVSKTYDGNATAYLSPANYTLTGMVNGDNVLLNNPATGTYNNKNVGTNKTVNVTGLALTGTKAGCYTLACTRVCKNIGIITTTCKSGEITTTVEPEIAYVDLKVYPNPFSDKLRFEFVSPESVDARIDLYDMTGRMVKTIFEAPVEGGVSYEAEFKPETIISGMYIYRVTLGEAIYNGKIVFKKE